MPSPTPNAPAAPECDERLHELEALGLGALPGIDEAAHARSGVRADGDVERAADRARDHGQREHAQRQARGEQHEADHRAQHHRAAEVGLEQEQQATGGAISSATRWSSAQEARLFGVAFASSAATASAVVRRAGLRGLDRERHARNQQPAPRAVRLDPEERGRGEQRDRAPPRASSETRSHIASGARAASAAQTSANATPDAWRSASGGSVCPISSAAVAL